MLQIELLSLVIWFPIIGGILVLATGGERNAPIARKLALGFSVATFLLSLPLYTRFDKTSVGMQFVERVSWVDALHIEYYLGVDGISMPFILLTLPYSLRGIQAFSGVEPMDFASFRNLALINEPDDFSTVWFVQYFKTIYLICFLLTAFSAGLHLIFQTSKPIAIKK